jgi:hypothetical protein
MADGFELGDPAQNQSVQGAVVETGTLAVSQSGGFGTEQDSFSTLFFRRYSKD